MLHLSSSFVQLSFLVRHFQPRTFKDRIKWKYTNVWRYTLVWVCLILCQSNKLPLLFCIHTNKVCTFWDGPISLCCFVYQCNSRLTEMVHFDGDGPFSLYCFVYQCSKQGTYRDGPLYLYCYVCQCNYGLTEMVHFALTVLCASAYK